MSPRVGRGRINLNRQFLILAKIVIQRSAGRAVDVARIRRMRLGFGDLLRQFDDLRQVSLIFHRRLLTQLDQGIQQFRHLLVVLRIDRHLVDNDLANVVFNRLGHRFLAAANTLGQ